LRTIGLTPPTDQIEAFGNTANELGTYTTTTRDGEQLDIGSYVVVWKKTDDGWKLGWNFLTAIYPQIKNVSFQKGEVLLGVSGMKN
jgi:ketosteroid isomerase-like protein